MFFYNTLIEKEDLYANHEEDGFLLKKQSYFIWNSKNYFDKITRNNTKFLINKFYRKLFFSLSLTLQKLKV